ncbi:TrbG/VirB9 family P-type conjugative transfer protein [Salmonella enterica]
MKKILLAGCIAATLPGIANALNVPQPTSYDARIQEATYNPDDAVLVRVKAGTSTLIKLQDGEFITDDQAGMGFGDPDAWDVSVRGNNIFIRPIAEQPDTNVTLVSNKRTYVFFLQSVKGNPSWMVRFKYPKKYSAANATVFKRPPCQSNGAYNANWNYQLQGKESFAPYEVWDDGRFTCFKFNPSSDLPMIYRVAGDGEEMLVNGNPDSENNNIIVVQETNPEFVIRLGKKVVAVRSDTIKAMPSNRSGTTNGMTREIKSDE